MQIQKLTESKYLVRIEPGEKLMANLERFMRDGQFGFVDFSIPAGGGLVDIECSFSEKLEKGGSVEHKLDGPMELGGAGGNISWIRNDPNDPDNPKTHIPAVHCHVCLGDKDGLKGYVAHLKEATVKLTAEIKIEVYKEKIFRKLDEKLGLMLLNLPQYTGEIQKGESDNQGGSQQGHSGIDFGFPGGDEEGGSHQEQSIEGLKKKNQELRKQNTELNKTNAELSGRLAQISVPPKG